MAKQNPEVSALQEQIADAQAQIEALQSAAAGAAGGSNGQAWHFGNTRPKIAQIPLTVIGA